MKDCQFGVSPVNYSDSDSEKVYDPKTRQTNDYCAHDLYPNSQQLVLYKKKRFRSKILILNTYLYLLFAVVHNKVIPGYKDITFHIFS